MLDVLTITLNPAIDQTVYINDFMIDKVNRISRLQNDPGGKGINVASYLASSDLNVGVTGFLGLDNEKIFHDIFNKLNIENKFISVLGETRTNIKIVDQNNKTVTDVNQAGFDLTKKNISDLENLLFSKKEAKVYVFSGSIPSGIDIDIYEKWTKKAHDLGIKVAIDASGKALKSILKAKPDLIKPNHLELSEILLKDLDNLEDIIIEAKELIKNGIQTVCISMGEKGALYINKDEIIQSIPSNVELNTTVGAGDAMLAGLIVGSLRNLSNKETLKLATAYSMSAVETVGPYLCSNEKINNYYKNIEINKI